MQGFCKPQKMVRFHLGPPRAYIGFDSDGTLILQVGGDLNRKKWINLNFIKTLFSKVKTAFLGTSVELAFEMPTFPRADVSLA